MFFLHRNSSRFDLLYYFGILILSIILRSIVGYYGWYTEDHLRIFDLGFRVFHEGLIPTHGAPVMWTDPPSLLPGSFQGILAAVPLFISNGNPYSIILFIQLLNLLTCVIIFNIYSNLFFRLNKYLLFAFFILNPMSIIYSYAWNPSFIPVLSCLFFLGIIRIFRNRKDVFSLFLVYFPHLLIFQLNLQFAALVLILIVLIIKGIVPLPNFKVFIISILPGALTLAPTIISYFYNLPFFIKDNWPYKGHILESISFNFNNALQYFHILARILSFSTGETTRNISLKYITQNSFLIPFFIIGMIGTAYILIIAFAYYFKISRWKTLIKKNLNFEEKLDFLMIILPICTSLLFIFSIAPPTTHKLWIFFPFCFYPFLKVYSQMSLEFILLKILNRVPNKFTDFNKKTLIYIYIGSVLIYSCIGACKIDGGDTFNYSMNNYEQYCHEYIKTNSRDPNLMINNKNSYLSWLCPYYIYNNKLNKGQ